MTFLKNISKYKLIYDLRVFTYEIRVPIEENCIILEFHLRRYRLPIYLEYYVGTLFCLNADFAHLLRLLNIYKV